MPKTPHERACTGIEECRKLGTQGRVLNLSGLGLTELPDQIWELTALRTLDLSKNQFSGLPPEFGRLTELRHLDISKNHLASLPPEFSQLENLRVLNLSGNQLTALPPEILQLTTLVLLDVSANRLAELPPEIGGLTNLSVLDVSQNRITGALTPEIGRLTRLTQLDLYGNHFTELPPEIGELSLLKILTAHRNHLTGLPPDLGQLGELFRLYIFGNKIRSLPRELGRLSKLTLLSASHNQLTGLPKEIFGHVPLHTLDVAHNELTLLPPDIGELSTLQKLDVSHNQLGHLPPEIGDLKSLLEFKASHNRITTLPNEISHLTTLSILDISHNSLRALPPEIGSLLSLTELFAHHNHFSNLPLEITRLVFLNVLNVSDNQLRHLPPYLSELSRLTTLNAAHNLLTSVHPALSGLKELRLLDVSANHLTHLPSGLDPIANWLDQLFLHENPGLGIPIDVLGPRAEKIFASVGLLSAAPPAKILKFHRDHHPAPPKEVPEPVGEVKIMLTGPNAAGKEHLYSLLSRRQPTAPGGPPLVREKVFLPLNDPKIKAHLWHLAGAASTQPSQSLLFTEGSIIFIVFDPRSDTEVRDARHTLESLKAHASGASVVLALHSPERLTPGMERALREEFPMVKAVMPFRQNAVNATALKGALTTALETLPLTQPPRLAITPTWRAITESCTRLGEDYISFDHFISICEKHGEFDEAAQRSIARQMHWLGLAFYLGDDPVLRETLVLKPESIIDDADLLLWNKDSRGHIFLSTAETLLAARPPDTARYLLVLMERHEWCDFREEEHGPAWVFPDPLKDDPPAPQEARRPRLFLSYARMNLEEKKVFAKSLKAMQRRGLITFWDDDQIQAGTEWRKKITQELDIMDIFVCLVSNDFFGSDFIHEVELPAAMERLHDPKFLFAPIMLYPVPLSGHPLADLHIIRPGDQALKQFPDLETGCIAAQRILEDLILKQWPL